MARFPITEGDRASLAEAIVKGLREHPGVYEAPPVNPEQLEELLSDFLESRDKAAAAHAASELATKEKDQALKQLVDAMKKNLRYAENTTDSNDDKLKLIGWSARKRSRRKLPPGAVQQLNVSNHGDNWIELEWQVPETGGNAKEYHVMRRILPEKEWEIVDTTPITKSTLVEQPAGEEIEYRVVASNRIGQGPPSPIESIVLEPKQPVGTGFHY